MYQIQNSSKLNIGNCISCNNFGEISPIAPLLTPGMTPYYEPEIKQTLSGITLLLLGAVGMFMLIQIAYKR